MGKKRSNGQGTVTERKDGRWEAAITIDGRRHRFYSRTKDEAETRLRQALHDHKDKGLPLVFERQTVGEFLTDWLENTVRPGSRLSTYTGYESKLRTHVLPAIGGVRLAKLTPQRVQAFFNAKQAEGLSPQTVRHVRAILRAALNLEKKKKKSL